ncbi:hypothetical protein Phou_072680 [Phytohabitans houttuyneae]|uniref:Uncharacterized protein n=1 Tax=Phytohabitans houttuyneae TaxID=1076126 RepID=A0A6V8KKR2_9ACTN|nr:hypothetical protein Phou_072680 [Phytohabitans houttuyneae]
MVGDDGGPAVGGGHRLQQCAGQVLLGGEGRRTVRPAYPTRCGLAPRKIGAGETTPSATVMLTEMWWPSKRQPHSVSGPGSPKTATQ